MGNNIIVQPGEHGNIQASFDYFLQQNIAKDAKILDIGCRFGSLIYNFYKRGYKNVYGIDIKKEYSEEGGKNYPEIKDRLYSYL